MYRPNFLPFICGVVALFLALPSYGSHHFPDYPARSATEYANKIVEAALILGVEPVEDAEQQKMYFNSHLSARGILPVFIVIQNNSAADAYLLDKSAVGLGDAAEVTGKGARKTASQLGSGGLVDLTLVREVTDVRENLMKKELRSKTIAPGSSVYGFVYVPVPTDAPRKKMHLQVPLTNARTSENEVLNLFF